MPAFDPIHIPSFVGKKYLDKIQAINNYLTDAFPDGVVDIAYSVDRFSIGFRVSDSRGQNVVFFKSMFLEYLDAPMNTWLNNSGIKEFMAMNNESTLTVKRSGKLHLQAN